MTLGDPVAAVVACTVVNALAVVTCAHKSSLRQAQEHIILLQGTSVRRRRYHSAATSGAVWQC